jgi:hypothetical protein
MARTARAGKLEVPSVPAIVPWVTVIAGGAVTLLLGLFWGIRFYTVYLDYWPADTEYTSVFMRMTASDAKPFAACEFIRQNKLSGKMFNYWTEGGFIAWGQDPDPNTGKVPLQLFMDGRAQAAYDVRAFDLWTDIMSGGPAATPALLAQRRPTRSESIDIGEWVNEQLKKQNVWVVLMPNGQFDKPFTIGLEYSPDWRTVYMDDKQRLFVDITTPKGEQLVRGMFTHETEYPDKYSEDLTVGHNYLLFPDADQKKKGIELLAGAMDVTFAPAPLLEMLMIGWQFPELRPRIIEICEGYVQDFEKNHAAYAKRDGYNQRLEAIRLALILLQQQAQNSRSTQLAEAYNREIATYEVQRERILLMKRW